MKATVKCRKWHSLVSMHPLFLPEILGVDSNCAQALIGIGTVGGGAAGSYGWEEGQWGSHGVVPLQRLISHVPGGGCGSSYCAFFLPGAGADDGGGGWEKKNMKWRAFTKLTFTPQICRQNPRKWGCGKANQTWMLTRHGQANQPWSCFESWYFFVNIPVLVHLLIPSLEYYCALFPSRFSTRQFVLSFYFICNLAPFSQPFHSPN